MGVVYQAVDPTIGRTLAIKTIRLREVDDLAQRERLKERLFREARSAGVLSHPNILTIYDMEEDDGVAYIAMQFVNGPTLDEVMSRPKAMGAQELFRILRQTASALDFAHAKGIVHRDIKPANIMIDEHGTAKVADFGIAKVGTSGNLTLSGTILGTPNYMSPEQVQGKFVDGRADQFSLAVVAYEILTGERPFGGEHLGTVVYKIVAEEPPVVQRLNPSLSPAIDAVIRKALSKKADARYANCIDFVNALEGACLQAEGWQSLARGTSHNIPTEADPAAKTRAPKTERSSLSRKKSSTARVAPQQKSKSSVFFPALGAFVVVLGVLGLLAWQSGLWQPEADKEAAVRQAPAPEAVRESPKPPQDRPTEDKQAEAKQAEAKPPDAKQADTATSPKNDDVETPPTPGPETPQTTTRQATTPQGTTHQANNTEQHPKSEVVPAVIRKNTKTPPEVKPVQKSSVAALETPRLANPPQDIFVQSNPPGATALLDNRPDTACETPCLILAPPGSHILSLTLASYQKEIRPVKVAGARVDVPLITLHPNGGTLMVVSDPPGANIFVDDRLLGSMTPARIDLPPGSYTIRVELNGMRTTKRVDITNGSLERLKLVLTR
jgi:serine/threonine-protein kinase